MQIAETDGRVEGGGALRVPPPQGDQMHHKAGKRKKTHVTTPIFTPAAQIHSHITCQRLQPDTRRAQNGPPSKHMPSEEVIQWLSSLVLGFFLFLWLSSSGPVIRHSWLMGPTAKNVCFVGSSKGTRKGNVCKRTHLGSSSRGQVGALDGKGS